MRSGRYTSFDVYDTLIKRIVSTQHLYQLMEKEVMQRFQLNNFSERRINAENRLKQQGEDCFSLTDIYNTIEFAELSRENREALLHYEEKCETENTLPNETGRKLYDLYSGCSVCICISDMYLGSTILRRILERSGYNGIDKIFVSCEEKCSKRQGLLFEKVIKDLQIHKREIIHIGDAVRSDFLNAIRQGIPARWIRNPGYGLMTTGSYFYDTGYSVLGPVFYEFMVWLKEKGAGKQMYFLSREGEFLKQCYERIHGTKEKILYVSREAVIHGSIASLLETMETTGVLKHITIQRNETPRRLLRRLGLDQEKYAQLLISEGLRPDIAVTEKFVQFIDKHKNEIIKDTRKNEKYFAEYLEQTIMWEQKSILLVDIGWNGSMQELITDYLNTRQRKFVMEGAYLGCTDSCSKNGYLFQTRDTVCADILSFSILLEYASMPSYGTVTGYEKEDNRIIPVFGKCELSPEASAMIHDLQRGILDLMDALSLWGGQPVFQKEKILKNLLRFGCSPGLRDVKAFGGITVYENGRIYPLTDVPSGKDFLHPAGIYHKFLECGWKAGWMRLTCKLPLPWYRLLRLLRRSADRNRNKSNAWHPGGKCKRKDTGYTCKG